MKNGLWPSEVSGRRARRCDSFIHAQCRGEVGVRGDSAASPSSPPPGHDSEEQPERQVIKHTHRENGKWPNLPPTPYVFNDQWWGWVPTVSHRLEQLASHTGSTEAWPAGLTTVPHWPAHHPSHTQLACSPLSCDTLASLYPGRWRLALCVFIKGQLSTVLQGYISL